MATPLPDALDKLATLLSRMPGVGRRTALRYAFFMADEGHAFQEQLAECLQQLQIAIKHCQHCNMLSQTPICRICEDPLRDKTVCVVAHVQDLLAIEKTGVYRGRYHVLHGVLSPLEGIGPDELRFETLAERIANQALEEVIIATSSDVEGEATALFLADWLRSEVGDIRVTRIATGIPMGGELEYLDGKTVGRALTGRHEM